MANHILALSSALLLGSSLLGGCYSRSGGPWTEAYGETLGPSLLSVLGDSSGVKVSWHGGGGTSGSSSFGGSKWSVESSRSGTFECAPSDLEVLSKNLYDGLRLDLFGAGFLVNDDEEFTKLYPFTAGGSPAFEFDIEHYRAVSRGTLAFTAFPKGAGEYKFVIDFAEDSN